MFLVTFDNINKFLRSELKDKNQDNILKTELSHLANSYHTNYKVSLSALKKHKVLKNLKNKHNLIIVRPDKGNGVVILEKQNYLKGMHALINDKTKFKLLEHDLTEKREGQLQRYLLELKKKGFFTNEDYKDIYPNGSQPSRMYGLPKLHKNFDSDNIPKFRPICSSIGSFNYKLAKHLSKILTPLIPNKHSTKDTFNFIKEIQQVNSKDLYMVSYDVCSLYTNILLKEAIEISVEKIFENNPHIKITKDELKNLFYFATSKTHFQFEGSMYDQNDGIAMGSHIKMLMS